MKFNLFKFTPKAFQQRHYMTEDGHQIFYARYGNPKGQMIVCFHSGPGGRGSVKKSSFEGFDLKKYQMLFINQRGCGLSLPTGKIEGNDTENLIHDAKNIIEETGYQGKIILKGGSWGSTLALLFAQRYPAMVDKMVLSQIYLANKRNDDWMHKKARLFYPDIINKLEEKCKKGESLVDCYHRLAFSDSVLDVKKALETYGSYEYMLGSVNPSLPERETVSESEIASFRICMHYLKNNLFIKENQILDNMHLIRNIPALMVHNRLDFACPLEGAYELSKEFDNAKLVIVGEKGHIGKLLYQTMAQETQEFLA